MELRDLDYLLACVDARSFTKAAKRIHVAQPTLSHALKRLEAEVGHALVQRPNARGGVVVPTEAGAMLVACARQINEALVAFESEIASLDGVLRGEVLLGAAPSLAMSFVPRVLERMQTVAPAVRMSVETGSTDELVERVRSRAIDAALVADIRKGASVGLVTTVLFEEAFVVVAGGRLPLASRVRLVDIAKGPLLLPTLGIFHGLRIREAFANASCGKIEPRAVFGSAEALVAAARQGLGYALLPERCIERGEARLRVARIKGAPVTRTVHFVAHREAAGRAVVGALREAVEHEGRRSPRPRPDPG